MTLHCKVLAYSVKRSGLGDEIDAANHHFVIRGVTPADGGVRVWVCAIFLGIVEVRYDLDSSAARDVKRRLQPVHRLPIEIVGGRAEEHFGAAIRVSGFEFHILTA